MHKWQGTVKIGMEINKMVTERTTRECFKNIFPRTGKPRKNG